MNIYEEGELERAATLTEIEIVRLKGARRVVRLIEHYCLNMIISVGYRVSPKQATMFRRWATDKLVQFATKGFVVDKPGLRAPIAVTELQNFARSFAKLGPTNLTYIASFGRFVRCVSTTTLPQRSRATSKYPRTHQAWWTGKEPKEVDGRPLNGVKAHGSTTRCLEGLTPAMVLRCSLAVANSGATTNSSRRT